MVGIVVELDGKLQNIVCSDLRWNRYNKTVDLNFVSFTLQGVQSQITYPVIVSDVSGFFTNFRANGIRECYLLFCSTFGVNSNVVSSNMDSEFIG